MECLVGHRSQLRSGGANENGETVKCPLSPLRYFDIKPRLNDGGGRWLPIPLTRGSHIQIYVSRLEFYDLPPAPARATSERGRASAKPRASDSAAARKIFPIDSGQRRQ